MLEDRDLAGPILTEPAPAGPTGRPPAPLRFWLVVALGTVASAAVSAGSCLAGAADTTTVRGAWFFAVGATGSLQTAGSRAVEVGVPMLLVAWWLLIRDLRRRPGSSVRPLVLVFGLWALPILVAPPLFSGDIYIYAAEGQMLSHGITPYNHGVLALGTDPYLHFVDPVWRVMVQPFALVAIVLDRVAVAVAGHHVAGTVLFLRLVQLGGLALAGAGVVDLARHSESDPGHTFALAMCNPLTLLVVLATGHNDATMLGLLLAGLAAHRRGHPILGVLLCVLGGAVQVPALLGAAYIGWDWATSAPTWRAGLRRAAAGAAVGAGTMEGLGLVTGYGWAWVGALRDTGLITTLYTPTSEAALVVQRLAGHVGTVVSLQRTTTVIHDIGILSAVAVAGWLLLTSTRLGLLRSLAVALFVVAALGPSALPWYLSWGLFVMAPAATGRWRSLVIWISIAGTVLMIPQFDAALTAWGWAGKVCGLVCLAVAVAIGSQTIGDRWAQPRCAIGT